MISYAKNNDWPKPVPVTKHYSNWSNPTHQFHLIDGKVIEYKTLVVYRCSFLEDTYDIVFSELFSQWQNSEAGQWAMNHAVERPCWYKTLDHERAIHNVAVTAKFSTKHATFWQLKYGHKI